MSIQVVLVPNPAAGADWSYVVPGQWAPYFVGATAQLVTNANPTVFADKSGNARDATINPDTAWTFQVAGPFAGGAGNFAAQVGTPTQHGAVEMAKTAAAAAFANAQWTMDYWVRITQDATVGQTWGMHGVFPGAGGNSRFAFAQPGGGGDPWDLRVLAAGIPIFTMANIASLNAWHHIAVKYDGVNWTSYVDGVLFLTNAHAGPTEISPQIVKLCGGNDTNQPCVGSHASVAYYPVALADANIAAHAAANASQTAYQTAVLADTPAGYWPMNELISKTSRQATLVVTDGTTKVLQVPGGFTLTNAGTFTWSWQVLGPSASQSVDGSVATVPIPELAVAAGYRIGTITLDIVATDQWSGITLWFDDGTGSAAGGGTYAEPAYLDALLVPPDWSPGP